ncbi:unnamed protein product [Haemonchus placei]|uniref:Uncharacterized protein n=1 Tax=Haemonchus placei TaxID=6290 RepID=A0A0N4XBZ8_HAEPC|nr:unnamed protein product [Haemonchus placei]
MCSRWNGCRRTYHGTPWSTDWRYHGSSLWLQLQ